MQISLALRPERHHIPRGTSFRHVDFLVCAHDTPSEPRPAREPLTLALVLDRSGSMSGDKVVTAKRAALAVLQQLDERDTAAVVVFDEQIDTIQPATSVTAEVKAHVRNRLDTIDARGSTALHEGWLTGCNAIATDGASGRAMARCFLLTDGQANVGITDPEQIASQAAGIRANTSIGTSTFGIGDDYAEELLGPMAEAGGGRFHHLRSAAEIATTFVGELGEMLAVAAANVRLELEVEPGVIVEVVSTYWATPSTEHAERWSITLGDLLTGEDRHAVVRLGFADQPRREAQVIRARVLWTAGGAERETGWQELAFTYADDTVCDTEQQDPEVMRWVGQHLSDRTQREALRLSKHGDLAGAHASLGEASRAIRTYSGGSPELEAELAELDALEMEIGLSALPSARAKELYYLKQMKTSGYRDLRRRAGSPGAETDELDRLSDRDEGRLIAEYLKTNGSWADSAQGSLSADVLRDRARGTLLWGAAGDALGRPAEGLSPEEIRARFGPSGIQRFIPPLNWKVGPTGTVTNDTQLTMELARSLIATNGQLRAEEFARRLLDGLPHARGAGITVTEAVEALASGVPWWRSGRRARGGGNGAAMRVAPVGVAHALETSPLALRRDAVLSALPTHAEQIGVAGAVAMAAGVAYALRQALSGAGQLDVAAFITAIADAIAGIESAPSRERRPGAGEIRLVDRIRELPALLALPTPQEAFARTWNGAYTLESVPAALYCFLRSPDDPRQVLHTAVNAGYDANTVASMAGNLVGAWCGAERMWRDARDWWDELEYREELTRLADQLAEIALRSAGATQA